MMSFSKFLPGLLFLFNSLGTELHAELRPWPEYQAIMWVGESPYKDAARIPLFFERMKEMGISAITLGNEVDPSLAVTNGMGFYVENIVNRGLCLKFHSKVTDWDRFVTEWVKNGRPESALVRDYSLDDPTWRRWAGRQMTEAAKIAKGGKPLLYNIRDELSVTISANPFDYDFGAQSLAGFREHLKKEYGSLEALNREWETQFKTWEEVKPFTTDQIKNRMASNMAMPRGNPDWGELQRLKFEAGKAHESPARWNFAPWADFRGYMDSSLASALQEFRKVGAGVDSATPIGIEGTQMPSAWGGYDLWKLSQSLDWVEPYDIGCSREIFGSFMPGKPVLTTVFEKDRLNAQRRLWHLLLEGDKGCIIWWSEDSIDWKSSDYALTEKAKALAPVLKELRSPLARVFLRAEREYDPIAIQYSQASIQADWLLESTVDGSSWLRRFSSYESDHNRMAKVRESWLKAFQDLGYSPRFVSSEEIEKGALKKYRAFVMPESLALSDAEGKAIREFGQEGILFADGTPGMFDEHGKLRGEPALGTQFGLADSNEKIFAVRDGKVNAKEGDIAAHRGERLKGNLEWAKWIQSQFKEGQPAVALPVDARVRVHRYKLGGTRLVALERNISYQMSEDLKQAGGNESLETGTEVEAEFTEPGFVYDLRTGNFLGQGGKIKVPIDPWQPTLLAVFTRQLTSEKTGRILEELQSKDP